MQPKGRVHMSLGRNINNKLKNIHSNTNNEYLTKIVDIIDEEIYRNYKLWPSNYIAYDMLYASKFENKYKKVEKKVFQKYFQKSLQQLSGEKDVLAMYLLNMYANPVINKLKNNYI